MLELSHPENISTLQYWRHELVSAVIFAGADWDWCVELARVCFHNVELVELIGQVLKNVWRNGNNICLVSSGRAVAALRPLIQHTQPKMLNVHIPLTEPPPKHLEQLMEQLSLHFSETLNLELFRSYFCYEKCDTVVKRLTKAR